VHRLTDGGGTDLPASPPELRDLTATTGLLVGDQLASRWRRCRAVVGMRQSPGHDTDSAMYVHWLCLTMKQHQYHAIQSTSLHLRNRVGQDGNASSWAQSEGKGIIPYPGTSSRATEDAWASGCLQQAWPGTRLLLVEFPSIACVDPAPASCIELLICCRKVMRQAWCMRTDVSLSWSGVETVPQWSVLIPGPYLTRPGTSLLVCGDSSRTRR
jgi:hypothetical protein